MREGAHRMVSAVVRCLASDWESSMRSISRATPPAVLPGWRTRATASALNSEVNHRRRRRFLPATTRHTQWPLRGSGGDLQGLPLRLAEGIVCLPGGWLAPPARDPQADPQTAHRSVGRADDGTEFRRPFPCGTAEVVSIDRDAHSAQRTSSRSRRDAGGRPGRCSGLGREAQVPDAYSGGTTA
jgi:hypothetical protein